jgi:hypothetical protein
VHPEPASSCATTAGRPRLEVADILRVHGEAYRQRHALSAAQLRVLRDLVACRTPALGGHLDVCEACGHAAPSYNSCRNRHCPKCQSLSQARWIDGRIARTLPIHYFHVVFTLPSELHSLVLRRRELAFDLLFHAASRSLLELARHRLDAELGVTAVLHTWTRELRFHPHVHCIVTGGGLAPDGGRWVPTSPKYLLPVQVLGEVYRGKFLEHLRAAQRNKQLGMSDEDFEHLVDRLYRKAWVVYAKRPFGGAEHVIRYLGRYTHRVGISNQRMVALDERGVTFRTKAGKSVSAMPDDFIGRLLLHVLPPRFVKIRHYGLLSAGNVDTKLARARRLLDCPVETARESLVVATPGPKPSWQELLLRLTGIDVRQCPACHAATVMRRPLSPAIRAAEPTARDTS